MGVFDMDIHGAISVDGVATTFAHTDWDMTCAYGVQRCFGVGYTMYDNMPYRELDQDPDDVATGVAMITRRISNTYIRLAHLQYGDERHQIRSGFGGLAFYTMAGIKDAQYAGGICEHINLHESMRELGQDRIFLNPSMVLIAGQQGPSNVLDYVFRAGTSHQEIGKQRRSAESVFAHQTQVPHWLLPLT